MPDNDVNGVANTSTNGISPDEIKILESMAFSGIVPAQANQETDNNGAATTNNEVAGGAPAVIEPEFETVDVETFLKNEFGFDSVDAAKAAIQEYQTLKTNPPKAQPSFANDEAKKWYEYFAEGKEDDLYKSLSARQQLKNLEVLSDADRLKLYIKMQNPLFDDELINDEYNSLYTVNEDKFKDEITEEVNTLALRKEKLRSQQRIMNDVQKANEFFNQYKTKIELPSIKQEQQIDNDYESYKASTARDREHYQKDVEPAIRAAKEGDVGMSIKVADEQNQLDFNVNLQVDEKDLQQAKEDALNLSDYLDKNFYQDGKFIAPNYVRMLLRDRYFDKYVQSAARQAVMAERKRVVGASTNGFNNGNGSSRDYNTMGDDALKQLEQFAFPGN